MADRRLAASVAVAWLLMACEGPSAGSAAAAGSPSSGGDCSRLIGLSAPEVAAELLEHGLEVGWRLERTDPEQGPVSEAVESAPPGVVTNVAPAQGEVIVFVSPPDDPLAEFAVERLTCPWS